MNKPDWIKFLGTNINLREISLLQMIRMAEHYPAICHVVDADSGVIRMAAND